MLNKKLYFIKLQHKNKLDINDKHLGLICFR